jgi:dTDP-4-amino-4,6-dideoxygalactose transaminase
MKVPFLDLKAQYESIKDEVNEAIQKVLESCAFAGGPFVEEFEKNFAEFCQVKHCIGVGSGTEALWMALLALGVGPGDEVITVPNTFIATAEAISFCGATPIFVDIDEKTYTMDPIRLSEFVEKQCYFDKSKNQLINKSTKHSVKAVIPVHIFGQMADMDPIMEIARSYGLFVIEDACQAHGAEYRGRRAGSIGDAGCFSFYPGKNLGAYGEAGAITTNNSELEKNMAMFRDHGQSQKYYHKMIGWNARMDGLQGAVLNVKLKHLSGWNDARRQNAKLYQELLSDVEKIIKPAEVDYAKHAYHVYAIRVQDRDNILAKLAEKDIHCGIHYPVPVHLQDAYLNLGNEDHNLKKISERVSSELLSLPMYPELAKFQIEYVIEAIKQISGWS